MQFKVVAKPQNEFDQWVQQVKGTAPAMTKQDYEELKKPGLTENKMYSAFPEGLFEEIVQKYSHGHDMHHVMDPVAPAAQTGEKKEETSHETHQMSDMSNMPGMDHSGMKH